MGSRSGRHRILRRSRLAGDDDCQPPSLLPDPPLSPASRLLQGKAVWLLRGYQVSTDPTAQVSVSWPLISNGLYSSTMLLGSGQAVRWDRDLADTAFCVGAGLLAMRIISHPHCCLTHRYRQQAGSYRGRRCGCCGLPGQHRLHCTGVGVVAIDFERVVLVHHAAW